LRIGISVASSPDLEGQADHFRVLEVDTGTGPLSERVVGSWVDRTPEGFVVDVRAHRLLTHHPVPPESLWPEVRDLLSAELRSKRQLYAHDLAPRVLDEALNRYVQSIAPLAQFDKLGVIVFSFPSHFQPGTKSLDYLGWLRAGCGDRPVAIEFRHRSWVDSKHREQTLSFLEGTRLAYVCVDTPPGLESSLPPLAVATADVAVVRFHGRDLESWERAAETGDDDFGYEYRRVDLAPWVARLEKLAAGRRPVHALMNTRRRGAAARNARLLIRVLTEPPDESPDAAPPRPPGPSRRRRR
jgi:uncharacterized protein YecE (DUF72 family)